MSLLNFPINPTIGQTHTVGNKTYVWTGQAWILNSTNALTINNVTVTNYLNVTSSTNAVSTTSGALVVNGGVGIGGDLWIGGILYSGGVPVLTTASFNNTTQDGTDIDIVDLGGGILQWNNISTLQTVTGRGNTTSNIVYFNNTTQSTSTVTGAIVVKGGAGVGGNIWAEGRVTSESLKIADTVFDSTKITLTPLDGNGNQIIDTYSLDDYRAAKYFVQISKGLGTSATFQAQEITLIASNTSTVDISVYGKVTTNGPSGLGTFTAAIINTSTVELIFTPDYADNYVIKVLRTAMTS